MAILIVILAGYGIAYFKFRVAFHGQVIDVTCRPLQDAVIVAKYRTWDTLLKGLTWQSPWHPEIIKTDADGRFAFNLWATHFYIAKINYAGWRHTFPNQGKYNPNHTAIPDNLRSFGHFSAVSTHHRNDKNQPIIFWGYEDRGSNINFRETGSKNIGGAFRQVKQGVAEGIFQSYPYSHAALKRAGFAVYYDHKKNAMLLLGNIREVNESSQLTHQNITGPHTYNTIRINLGKTLSGKPQPINRKLIYSSRSISGYQYGYIEVNDIRLVDGRDSPYGNAGYTVSVYYDIVDIDDDADPRSTPLLVKPACQREGFAWLRD